jgi:hypothetical protein
MARGQGRARSVVGPFVVAVLGLAVGSFALPGFALAKKTSEKPVVTYTGLSVRKDGSAEFRVELSKSAVVVAKQKGKHARFLIEGATVARKTNTYPLEAAYFCVNVVKAKLDKSKEGVFVNLDLRDTSAVTFKVEAAPQGAVLEFAIPASTTGCK